MFNFFKTQLVSAFFSFFFIVLFLFIYSGSCFFQFLKQFFSSQAYITCFSLFLYTCCILRYCCYNVLYFLFLFSYFCLSTRSDFFFMKNATAQVLLYNNIIFLHGFFVILHSYVYFALFRSSFFQLFFAKTRVFCFFFNLALFYVVLGCLWSGQEVLWGGFWNWDMLEYCILLNLFGGLLLFHFFNNSRVLYYYNEVFLFFFGISFFFINKAGFSSSIHAFSDGSFSILFTPLLFFFIFIFFFFTKFFCFRRFFIFTFIFLSFFLTTWFSYFGGFSLFFLKYVFFFFFRFFFFFNFFFVNFFFIFSFFRLFLVFWYSKFLLAQHCLFFIYCFFFFIVFYTSFRLSAPFVDLSSFRPFLLIKNNEVAFYWFESSWELYLLLKGGARVIKFFVLYRDGVIFFSINFNGVSLIYSCRFFNFFFLIFFFKNIKKKYL